MPPTRTKPRNPAAPKPSRPEKDTANPRRRRGTMVSPPPPPTDPVLATDAPPTAPPRPLIVVSDDEASVADAGIAALGACPEAFVRNGKLVCLVPTTWDATPADLRHRWRIEPMPRPRLRELLSRHARWVIPTREDPTSLISTPVPQWAVRAIAARWHWPGVKVLTGFVTTPLLRPDGTVLQTPGHDAATGLFLVPDEKFPPIPATPTRDDAIAAIDELCSAAADFQFATPRDRSAWLAMVLTPFARFVTPGPAPLFMFGHRGERATIDALISVADAIMAGGPSMTMHQSDLLETTRRAIENLAARGEWSVDLRDAFRRRPQDVRDLLIRLRKLELRSPIVWFTTCWTVSGEPVDPGLVAIHLADLGREMPPTLAGFTIARGDVPAVVASRRGALVAAAVTVLRAWWAAERPAQDLPTPPGLEAWSRSVRGALVWAGQPDPVAPFDAPRSPTAPTFDAVADLIAGWAEMAATFRGECSVRQALDRLANTSNDQFVRLRSAVAYFDPGPLGDRATADHLGRVLTRHSQVVSEGMQLLRTGSGNQGNRWAARPVA